MRQPSLYRGYRKVGDKVFYAKSLWEANYALYLEWKKGEKMISDWFYEPKTFFFSTIKNGTRVYTPDFYVKGIDKSWWIEVKGFYDAKSLTKIKRFRKYFPDETLVLVDGGWFRRNSHKLKLIISEWETPDSLRIISPEKAETLRNS